MWRWSKKRGLEERNVCGAGLDAHLHMPLPTAASSVQRPHPSLPAVSSGQHSIAASLPLGTHLVLVPLQAALRAQVPHIHCSRLDIGTACNSMSSNAGMQGL